MKHSKAIIAVALLALAVGACSREAEEDGTGAKSSAWKRGRAVYVANCVACHNNDPSKEGPIGPAIQGSSKELLEARVLSTSYPPDYKPKRPTQVMPQFPFLKGEIPNLAEYLQ